MKVKIKVTPPGAAKIPGVITFGHSYKWRGLFYDMGIVYTIKKENFNPDIMESLEPKKPEPILPETSDEEPEGKETDEELEEEVEEPPEEEL